MEFSKQVTPHNMIIYYMIQNRIRQIRSGPSLMGDQYIWWLQFPMNHIKHKHINACIYANEDRQETTCIAPVIQTADISWYFVCGIINGPANTFLTALSHNDALKAVLQMPIPRYSSQNDYKSISTRNPQLTPKEEESPAATTTKSPQAVSKQHIPASSTMQPPSGLLIHNKKAAKNWQAVITEQCFSYPSLPLSFRYAAIEPWH